MRYVHSILAQLSDENTAGQERIDVWKSETLIALTALQENETRLEGASRKICNDLVGVFTPWLREAGPFAKVEGRFRREILNPAIRLHQDLKSSSHQYDMIPIRVFNKHSPKQMLVDWHLKDADLWQKPRGEKGVGRALYCLHPSIVRIRTQGTAPITIAKPVVVVISPERAKSSDPHNKKDSSLTSITVPPTAIESLSTTNQTTPSHVQDSSTQIKPADNSYMLMDSDSDTTSGSRSDGLDERRASPLPIEREREHLSRSRPRHLLASMESSEFEGHFPGELGFHHTDGRRADTFPPQAAARESSRSLSKDIARRSTYDSPISPSIPAQSDPPAKSRRLKGWLHRQK